MRDRLIELLLKSEPLHERDLDDDLADGEIEAIADHLLSEGVIIPPCKVGDIVYTINRRHPKKWKVHFIGYNSQGEFKMHIATEKFTEMIEAWDYDIGKIVFLTREEAERTLERSDNDT